MHVPLLASSRGRVVRLLRRAAQSVNELAATLGLTDNAVRAHLLRLERDGLVQQAGTRPGFRKPEAVYEITADAEHLFAKAYAPGAGNAACGVGSAARREGAPYLSPRRRQTFGSAAPGVHEGPFLREACCQDIEDP